MTDDELTEAVMVLLRPARDVWCKHYEPMTVPGARYGGDGRPICVRCEKSLTTHVLFAMHGLLVRKAAIAKERDSLAERLAASRLTVEANHHKNDMLSELRRTVDAENAAMSRRLTDLIAAIREHRDARGDDRCWMDDEALYAALPEGYTPPARDTSVELERCRQFIESRQNPATVYVSPQREIESLTARLKELQQERDELYQQTMHLTAGACGRGHMQRESKCPACHDLTRLRGAARGGEP